jgi:cobalt-precorrin 5A hydrolase / precorrin-3B C17-methyltransferase
VTRERLIGVVAATASGRAAAARLSAAWPDEVRVLTTEGAADGLREAWRTCDAVVSMLAVGATVRVLAPLIGDKAADPAVVCVDESLTFAVAVLGAHRGANLLADRLADVLGCRPVVTTASDRSNVTPLDSYGADLGFTVHDPRLLPRVGAAVLSGEPVRLDGAGAWPLPALPPNVSPNVSPDAGAGGHRILVSDEVVAESATTLVYRPPSLVVGVGSARGVPAAEVGALIDETLASAGLAAGSVRRLATVDLKADEPGILQVAAERGWEVVTHPAEVLAAVDVPNPSEVVRAAVGTPSVAEAAALTSARALGRAAELVAVKRTSANATAAVARLTPRGRLSIVGLGPGARDLLTPRAVTVLRRASVVVGLAQYVDQVRDLLRPGTRVVESGLGQEEERARAAVEEASAGHAVALVGSGDAGVYAMAAPALDLAAADVDVEGVPGITAALAAANLLGAPLGHDHAYISLSDLHTPWEAIERRVAAAAEGDFTVCFYNPRSRTRDWQLPKALSILAANRPPGTPVGYVRNATREDESVTLTTLAEFDPAVIDMFTVVVVGSSRSRTVAGRFVTPRGYRWA